MTGASNHILSIQAGLYGLSFFYRDGEKEFFRSIPFTVDNPAGIEKYLNRQLPEIKDAFQSVERVRLLHNNSLNVLVPEALYNEENKRDYLRNNVRIYATDRIETDRLPFIPGVNVYVPFVNLNNRLLDFFPSIDFFHSASLFLKYAFEQLTGDNAHIFVQFTGKEFRIVLFHKAKLLFFNTFPMKTTEDFLYYFFFVLEEWLPESNDAAIILCGLDKDTEKPTEELENFGYSPERRQHCEKEILQNVFL